MTTSKNWVDMNQREKATASVEMLRCFSVHRPSFVLKKLDQVVSAAQNGPPDGAADGTLSEEAWLILRDLHEAARKYVDALASARVEFMYTTPELPDD